MIWQKRNHEYKNLRFKFRTILSEVSSFVGNLVHSIRKILHANTFQLFSENSYLIPSFILMLYLKILPGKTYPNLSWHLSQTLLAPIPTYPGTYLNPSQNLSQPILAPIPTHPSTQPNPSQHLSQPILAPIPTYPSTYPNLSQHLSQHLSQPILAPIPTYPSTYPNPSWHLSQPVLATLTTPRGVCIRPFFHFVWSLFENDPLSFFF